MTRQHPLWVIVLCIAFAVGFTWLSLPPPQVALQGDNATKIVATHAQFTGDEELSDHVPSGIGKPIPLPISQGWQKRNLWVHLQIQAQGKVWLEMTPPRITLVRLHYQASDGKWRTQDNGAAIPVAQRQVGVPLIVFALDLPPGTEHAVWVEIRSRSPLSLSFALHQPDAFLPILAHSVMGDVLALGALVVLGAMAFGVCAVERDLTLFILGCRSVVVAVWTLQQTGLLSQVFPPAWVGPVATEILMIGQLTLIAQLATSWSYLRGCALPRWGHWVFASFLLALLVMLFLDVINVLSHPFIGAALVIVNAVVLTFSIAISGWLVWRKQLLAGMVLVTSLVALFFYLPVLLRLLGLAGQDVVVQRVFSPVPTVVILVLLFAGAVIQLQRSRRAAQQHAAQEQEQRVIWLEQRVAERTAELETAKNLAQQLNAAKSVFLAKVSHELRTPMHAILGYIDLAQRETLAPRLRNMLQVAHSAGRQLQIQIEDLLDFARLERTQLRLQTEVALVSDLHQTVVELALLQATESGNVFVHEFDQQLLHRTVLVDARRIEQVLMILVVNAFRYTQAGKVQLRTECAALTDATVQVRFVVHDTGRGISPHALGRIFEAFERGDTVDGDGMGLGLCIAQPLLALMHSSLEVESQVGVGSKFWFVVELPLMTDSATQSSVAECNTEATKLGEQDWLELAAIAQQGDITALEQWQQRCLAPSPELQRLVWTLDFEGIARFAKAQATGK